jgi:hypothetical protein
MIGVFALSALILCLGYYDLKSDEIDRFSHEDRWSDL